VSRDRSTSTINERAIPPTLRATFKSRVKSQYRYCVDAADVVFVTEDRPHETFRREGSDLHTTIDIFLREALIGTMVMLRSIDDRILRIPITSIVMYVDEVPSSRSARSALPTRLADRINPTESDFSSWLSHLAGQATRNACRARACPAPRILSKEAT